MTEMQAAFPRPVRKLWLAVVAGAVLGGAAASARTQSGTIGAAANAAASTTIVGTTAGASWRIDMPAHWNHKLVVYYHGYSQQPVTYKQTPPNGFERQFLGRGFALIQSGYSHTGYAVQYALPETEALREMFVARYGQPAETYVIGHSMGGELTMATIEQAPYTYTGALALCGLLGASDLHLQDMFAKVAAFDYYFPGVLPPLDPVPDSFQANGAFVRKLIRTLQANPRGAAAMRQLRLLHNNQDLARTMMFHVFVIQDMQHKAGGNPFDNRNYIYTGTDDDRALNDGVKRYAASGSAAQYLTRYYTPSGRLLRPMLAVHTTYDPLINPTSVFPYTQTVTRAGFSSNFVQQYVEADGHCKITPQQTGIAFDELLTWVHTDKRPKPGSLPEAK